MHSVETHAGWILRAPESWVFLGVWLIVVLGYGLWRSRGSATPDRVRESGPGGR